MKDSDIRELFSNLVRAVDSKVNADEALTRQSLTPILGEILSSATLSLVSKFLTELIFESVDPERSSFVTLSGVRLPIEMFPQLQILAAYLPSGDLAVLADLLQRAPVEFSFPEFSSVNMQDRDAVLRHVQSVVDGLLVLDEQGAPLTPSLPGGVQ